MQEIKKIVVIGPESTGKSTLCQLLANHYKTIWCPEYAREYLLANSTHYTYNDLLIIAKGQVELEDKYFENAMRNENQKNVKVKNAPLFIDTDLYVMKVWCEYVFNNCHNYILEQIAERQADMYLLCDIDLPWVKDELREYPDLESRKELYHIYKDILVNDRIPWTVVKGKQRQRLQVAIDAVDTLLSI